jgi:site-specific recombinase XerD
MTPLRQRMLEDMQVRNLSPHTQVSYVQQVSQFARHFANSPEQLGPEEIRTYQVYLTNEKKLAPGSIVIAVSALRFLYTVTLKKDWRVEDVIPAPKVPQTLPVVLSPDQVIQFLDCVASPKHRTILTTCYAAGLRISEAIALTSQAIDSRRMVIRVRARERAEGSVRDALAETAGDLARLVVPRAAYFLALPRRSPWTAHHSKRGRTGLRESPPPLSDSQTRDSAFSETRVRRTPA